MNPLAVVETFILRLEAGLRLGDAVGHVLGVRRPGRGCSRLMGDPDGLKLEAAVGVHHCRFEQELVRLHFDDPDPEGGVA